MLEGLTIIIGLVIVTGGALIATSKDNNFGLVSGMMTSALGLTALFWVARVTTPFLRADSTVRWLYKPLADMPEWVGYTGAAITATLWVVAVALLVDDYIHLPRRQKGGSR